MSVFFLASAVIFSLSGVLWLRASGTPLEPAAAERILVACVGLTAAVGFGGVLVHRLRVLPVRWKETEDYLAAIRRESARYRALMEGAGDVLLICDPVTGRLREWNARAREELGLGEPGNASVSIDSIVEAGDLARVREALALASRRPGSVTALTEVRLCHEAPQRRIADARLASIALEDADVVLLSLRDLTHQKEMERQLHLRERLSSIGLLTAGVAHEINNPLEGIANRLLLLERAGDDARARARHLEEVRQGFERIGRIVRDLLRFARPEECAGQADLAKVVDRAHRLARYSERMKQVEVSFHGLDEPLPVPGDAGRLEQVIFNLLLNAGAAMRACGRVHLSARIVRDDEGRRVVELRVEDEGPGIPAEELERIFDPFFTTTGGTGLGLSVSYGIVRAHGGELSAANRPEGGAVLTVLLPQGDAT